MGLTIFWTAFSENELQNIFIYHHEKVSIRVAIEITEGIVNETTILEKNPYIGQIEGNLIDNTKEIRYLISSNYKIIYWLNTEKNQIEILDVFDCRQEPLKIKRTK
jgi:plasmid stabilization system protein ParE